MITTCYNPSNYAKWKNLILKDHMVYDYLYMKFLE